MESINQRFPNHFSVQAFLLPCVRAAMKLREKDPSAALTILQPVEPYDLAANDFFNYGYSAYLRGLAYLQCGSAIFVKRGSVPRLAILLDMPQTAELKAGLPDGVLSCKARSNILLHLLLKMKLQFVVKLVLNGPSPE